jgi:pyruvate formate lyase activating enzyme
VKTTAAEELDRASDWFAANLGPEVPWHFTAFHPDFKLTDRPATGPDILRRARRQARGAGLHHVYTGNIHDPEGQTTFCPACQSPVIARDGYDITAWNLDARGRCVRCGATLPGCLESRPGTWGSRRRRLSVT